MGHEVGVGGVAAHVGDHGVIDGGIQVCDGVQQQIMGGGARQLHLLKGNAQRRRLVGANPYGDDARLGKPFVVGGFKHQHRRLALPRHHQGKYAQRNHLNSNQPKYLPIVP